MPPFNSGQATLPGLHYTASGFAPLASPMPAKSPSAPLDAANHAPALRGQPKASCELNASSHALRLYRVQYTGRGPTLHINRGDLEGSLPELLKAVPGLTLEVLDAETLRSNITHQREELVLIEICGPLPQDYARIKGIAQIAAPTSTLVVVDELPDDRYTLHRNLRTAGIVTFLAKSNLDSDRVIAAMQHALDLQALRKQLVETQGRFALALEGSRDGLWEWDISSGAVYYSPKCRELLGYPRDYPIQNLDDWLSRVHASDRSSLRHELSRHVYKAGEQRHREHRIRLPDGSLRWLASQAVAQIDHTGRVTRISGSLADVTQYRAREQALREQSRMDSTTRLPRVEVFFEQLARQIELARSQPAHEEERFAVVLLDIHGIATLQETHGPDHAALALRHMANRLTEGLTTEHKLCRFATAMFALLLVHDEPESEARTLIESFRHQLQEPFELDGQRVHFSLSGGAVVDTGTYTRVQDLVADASAAAAYARDKGPWNLQFFEAAMRQNLRSKMRMEAELREALHDHYDQFELFFQPIVNMVDRSVRGFESLIRWTHPELGKMPPVDFIPLAETTGLIMPLGRWILRSAAMQLQQWGESFDLSNFSLNVNISGRQAADPLLLREIERLLEMTQIEPSSLKIELTETVFLEDSAAFQRMAKSLRSRGIKLYIDDFGTGYSSLSYLHRFPVDGIKIDKSFVDNLAQDETSQALVRTIIALAESLNLDIVAEGIEHAEQASLLQAMGCPHGQGYLFGRPVDVRGATQALRPRLLHPKAPPKAG